MLHSPTDRKGRSMSKRSGEVGIIGLGHLGKAIGGHLLANGYTVGGYDPDEGAAHAAREIGIATLESARAVASRAATTIVLVGTDEQAVAACSSDDGIAHGIQSGDKVVFSATLSPTVVKALAETFAAMGVGVVDAPLARGAVAVEEGNALAFVGASAAHLADCRAVLDTFCADIEHVGAPGAGQVAKMVNNLLLWTTIVGNYEAFRLAQSFGVDLEALRQCVLLGSGANWALETWRRPRGMPWAEKDLEIVLATADENRVPIPLSRLVKSEIDVIRRAKIEWEAGRLTGMHEYIDETGPA